MKTESFYINVFLKSSKCFLDARNIYQIKRSSRRRRGKLAFKFGKPCGIARILGILLMNSCDT